MVVGGVYWLLSKVLMTGICCAVQVQADHELERCFEENGSLIGSLFDYGV
jgi:hypothetical protein